MGLVLWDTTDLLSSHRNTGRKGTIRDSQPVLLTKNISSYYPQFFMIKTYPLQRSVRMQYSRVE